MGGNLTKLDDQTKALLTNPEVIDVDRHSHSGRQVMNGSNKIVWTARGNAPGVAYVALFNTADTQQTLEYPLQSVGLASVSFQVRDLWKLQDIGTSDKVRAILQPHASALFKVTASK